MSDEGLVPGTTTGTTGTLASVTLPSAINAPVSAASTDTGNGSATSGSTSGTTGCSILQPVTSSLGL
jgi:hypothetical protein